MCQSSRPKSGEGGACLSSHASLHHASRQKNCHAISARVLGLSDGSKRPYKKPHTRASVCGWSSLITPALNTQIRERTKDRHIERTTRASLARGNRLDGRISRRAPPADGDAPRAFPARRRRQRTSGQPPLAEFGRVASRLALAGLALACSGVARVAAADPNGSYEIHAAIDAAFPEGARRSNVASPRRAP